VTSSKEAFEKFSIWKHCKTLLKVTSAENGKPPITFIGAVVLLEEEILQVGFMNHDLRLPIGVDFTNCLFTVGVRVLLAERDDGDFFKCEDTGRRWGKIDIEPAPVKIQ
jgi:hypothetical protein